MKRNSTMQIAGIKSKDENSIGEVLDTKDEFSMLEQDGIDPEADLMFN